MACAILLAACSALPTPPSEQMLNTYRFEASPMRAASGPRQPAIAVSRPRAAAGYVTPRIAYQQRDYELLYYSSNEWVAEPTTLLDAALRAALQQSNAFAAVLDDADIRLARTRLDVELLELKHDLRVSPAVGHVRMRAQRVDLDAGQLQSSEVFEHVQPVEAPGPYAGVRAINEALEIVLGDVVDFARGAR